MSTEINGLQGITKRRSSKASYMSTHGCGPDVLNLVTGFILQTATHTEHGLDKMKEVSKFFLFSPKREGLLKTILSKNPHFSVGGKKLVYNTASPDGLKTLKDMDIFWLGCSVLFKRLK